VRPKTKLIVRIAVVLLGVYLSMCVAGGILLAEMQLHPPRMPLRHAAQMRRYVKAMFGADLQDVAVTAADGAILSAWYVKPKQDNGSTVLLVHGVGDNRDGVIGYAHMFLQHGYRVVLPDSRAHGVSGGTIATYGLKEADDIRRWVDWASADHPKCVYGFGESMGAAVLIQSLAGESRFCAVVVESAFARFDEVAPERTAGYTRMPTWVGKTLERAIVEFAMLYTRWRYGLDFRQANPADALAHSDVPVLLIAGTRDRDILPHHSEELARSDPHAQLWMVQGAAHGGASQANPQLFTERVTGFFSDHGARTAKNR
jgi:uncharacterized protein